jgi:uncharacterized protein YbbC (DUF1343 family)
MHLRILLLSCMWLAGCARPLVVAAPAQSHVRPGISVLMSDSIGLIRGRRIALLTNQTGIDENRRSDIDLLHGSAGKAAGVTLVRLFSPEHGIRGTEDREHIPGGVDPESGVPYYSLYDAGTSAPPDSLLRDVDAVIVDLQDIGTRTWTYVGAMLYTLQTAARLHLRVIVLDRPNPITGSHTDGPVLDSTLSNAWPTRDGRAGKAFALYPMPLRHGMTMGELARFYDNALALHADLVVVPVLGWRRSMWFDETGLPWVKPSPNLPTLTSGLLYPGLVAFEGTNVSVGRGTDDAFQRFGASWMNAVGIAARLNAMGQPGLRFDVDSFTPRAPGDGKFSGQHIAGVHIVVTNRDVVDPGLLGAAVLSAIHATNPDSLRINARTFDERFGNPGIREAILRGEDPVNLMKPVREADRAFAQRVRAVYIYH